MTDVVRTRTELTARLAVARRPTGLVPTMGALHDGHLALMARARQLDTTVVVSIFVNPLQFGDPADLARYPRDLDTDVERCATAGVDVVWAPGVDDMYPAGDVAVRVDPGPLGDDLEGASRPGHFAGALTVVAKLFGTVRPERAYFGEKDFQQVTLVRQMANDLDLGVDVFGVPTVREADGLAMSSRNVFLSAAEREVAAVLPRALRAGAAAGSDGADAVMAAARAQLSGTPEIEVDYLVLRSPALAPAPPHGHARLMLAARIGSVRLIDNVPVELG